MNQKIYTHWGSRNFDPYKFKEIKNHKVLNKPIGGLWASPNDTNYTWIQWVKHNNFNETINENKYNEKIYFQFTLKEEAKLLRLDNEIANKLYKHRQELFGLEYIDWEELSKKYDAVELYMNDFDMFSTLHEFDVDSLIVFNPDAIEIIK